MEKLPTWVEVNLDVLRRNIELVKGKLAPGVKVLLTVKADAYGHGAVEVAQAARGAVDMFGVATVDEALELDRAGVHDRILILSPILEKEIPIVVEKDFAATVSSYGFAKLLSRCALKSGREVELHVEIDTGMGRTGVLPDEAPGLIKKTAALDGVRLGGAFTHFPVSDANPGVTRGQVWEFLAIVEALRQAGVEVPIIHSANSAAVLSVPESHMEMVRPGLVMYGHFPAGVRREIPVEPVMCWKSRLVQIRRVPAGTTVSYGQTFATTRKTLMGIVPVGYGHGYPFRLSNTGSMIAGGQRVPVIGRVTMDMTMVDLTDVPVAPAVGDEVVLFGEQGGEMILVDEIAEWAGSISYEILCGISKRVPRTYIRRGKVDSYRSLLGAGQGGPRG